MTPTTDTEPRETGIGTANGANIRPPSVGEPPDPHAPPARRGAPSGIKRRVPTGGAQHATGDPVLHYALTLRELELLCAWTITGHDPPQPLTEREHARIQRLQAELQIYCADAMVSADVSYELFVPDKLLVEIICFAHEGANARELARRALHVDDLPFAARVRPCIARLRSRSALTQR